MAYITLHIGLGTFRPVDVEDLTKHKMDSENFIVGDEAVAIVNKALDNKNRVCAIGTTTMRALESAVSANEQIKGTRRLDGQIHFPSLRFQDLQCDDHQLSHAGVDIADDGFCLCRLRFSDGSLLGGKEGKI